MIRNRNDSQCAMRNVKSAIYNVDADTSKINQQHIVASHAGILSIAVYLPDMCPLSLSFWYQLQTCEITLLQEISSYLPANDAWDGPLGTSLFFNTFSMHRHLQNTCVLYLSRLRTCYVIRLVDVEHHVTAKKGVKTATTLKIWPLISFQRQPNMLL
jgi:hypothetical protein